MRIKRCNSRTGCIDIASELLSYCHFKDPLVFQSGLVLYCVDDYDGSLQNFGIPKGQQFQQSEIGVHVMSAGINLEMSLAEVV